MLRAAALAVLLWLGVTAAAHAADVQGLWQGPLEIGDNRAFRLVMRIEARQPGLACFVNIIERGPEARRCANFAVEGASIRFAVTEVGGRFEGRMSGDGQAVEGVWIGAAGKTPLKFTRVAEAAAWPTDGADHKLQLVTTDDGLKIEVLDFGGEGPPLLLLAGLGASAHTFDSFAARLKASHHVYAMSRRGFGLSDMPEATDANYSTRRLGDDVMAVVAALQMSRPVLAGWSLGGAELSSVGSRFPERISALIYLEAAYGYAFYAPGNVTPYNANPTIDASVLRDKIRSADAPNLTPARAAAVLDDVLLNELPRLQADLIASRDALRAMAPMADPTGAVTPVMRVSQAIAANFEPFGPMPVPVLAVFALYKPATVSAAAVANQKQQIARYRAGNPKATVVEIPDADHAVFRSNPDEVLKAMEAFLAQPGR